MLTISVIFYILIIILIYKPVVQSCRIPNPMQRPPPETAPLNTPIPTVRSGELLGTQGALQIDHKGAIYTLRATSKGGLILTK